MKDKKARFLELLHRKVFVFDGAMGTGIHSLDLPLADYQNLENCTEILNLTRPDAVTELHRQYFAVGCDAVETNTFGGMPHVLREFDLQDRAREINRSAAQIARKAALEFSTEESPRFVFGSMGPGTKLVSLRQISYDDLLASYLEQARGLLEGDVDGFIIETCQDILQCKTAIHAVRLAMRERSVRLPLIVQITMETTGTMLVGTDIAAALTAIEAYPEVDVIGLNCATGPQEMSEHIRYLTGATSRFLSVQPNAGLPQVVNGKAHFPLTPEELAKWLKEFVEADGVNIVGGCCGTTPAHLRAVIEAVRERTPKVRKPVHEPASSSLYQIASHRQDNSFLIVGERCNTNGSRAFKRLLEADDIDGMVSVGTEQVAEGAHVLDVCVDYVGRDGVPDMQLVVDRFAKDITVPLMLDSTEAPVIEAGLKLAGGKCLVNSVNLEEGEAKLDSICPLLQQYGAGVVALTIDEDPIEAMAKVAQRKIEIAERLHGLLTQKWGLPEEDIFFDCLTFPITTGNSEDRRLALETLDGIKRIMTRFPKCQTILGVSNVSFGLVPAARVVLNSAFLHEARENGLTAAIVHASKILPRNKISDERWEAALNLIYDKSETALEEFIGLFSADEKIAEKEQIADLPIEERLKRRIIDGNRVGLPADLDEAMTSYKPLQIVNEFLLDGMKVVGELFGSGQMQLPFVLKSAETMKAAVAHLEPHMEKVEGQSKGKIVLATVRGDVHDIGKNLVDIILSNNGYTVYNLGIKQPINNVITALREHDADAIGLSGLLVKSTIVMRDDLHVLNEQEITKPVILGGAALTRKYVEKDLREIYAGPLFYAKDAFEGLNLMRRFGSGDVSMGDAATAVADDDVDRELATTTAAVAEQTTRKLDEEAEQRYGLREIPAEDDQVAAPVKKKVAQPEKAVEREIAASTVALAERSSIARDVKVPTPPFWGARAVEQIPLRAALAYMNETMLFQVQWGFRKRGRSKEEFAHYIDREVRPIYRDLVARCEKEEILEPRAVYGYWPCNSDGNDLIIYDAPGKDWEQERWEDYQNHKGSPTMGPIPPQTQLREIVRFAFPRQHKAPHWCLSDFWRPVESGEVDVVAFHLVTAGTRVSDVARQWFADNQYQQYLFLHGLGVETAEALAEYMHKQVRMELGIADQDARDKQKLFQQGYQGSRYSFGYPACPALEDQEKLMTLLQPERIGVTLSEEYQLEPEQSTSAIIAHHPEARYFNVRK
ncbi:MAG: methionine synthase [Phycisphaerae bacterium]